MRSANLTEVLQVLFTPGCLLGPAQFFSANENARFHRKLVFAAWPRKPRWQWFFALISGVLFWYLVLFWYQLFTLFRNRARYCQVAPSIGFATQCKDLLILGLWFGVQPQAYYRYRLFERDRSSWLNWVFPQQQAVWHRVYSCPTDTESSEILGDKLRFERLARANNLPTTTTIDFIAAGTEFDLAQLFQRKNLFLKPNSANAMRGCFALDYDRVDDRYCLSGKTLASVWIDERDRGQIQTLIRESMDDMDYLVQDALQNSAEFSEFCGTSKLVTVRVVSARLEGRIEIVYPLLEVPATQPHRWNSYLLDSATGRISDRFSGSKETAADLRHSTKNSPVPKWTELVDTLRRAHGQFDDIKTLAWDLCITEDGPTLIEGNTGWGLVSVQAISAEPFLETLLSEACDPN